MSSPKIGGDRPIVVVAPTVTEKPIEIVPELVPLFVTPDAPPPAKLDTANTGGALASVGSSKGKPKAADDIYPAIFERSSQVVLGRYQAVCRTFDLYGAGSPRDAGVFKEKLLQARDVLRSDPNGREKFEKILTLFGSGIASGEHMRILWDGENPVAGVAITVDEVNALEKGPLEALFVSSGLQYQRFSERLSALKQPYSKKEQVFELYAEFPDLAGAFYRQAGYASFKGAFPPTFVEGSHPSPEERQFAADVDEWQTSEERWGYIKMAGLIAAGILLAIASGGIAVIAEVSAVGTAAVSGVLFAGVTGGYEVLQAGDALGRSQDAFLVGAASEQTVQYRSNELKGAVGALVINVVTVGVAARVGMGQVASEAFKLTLRTAGREICKGVLIGAGSGALATAMNPNVWDSDNTLGILAKASVVGGIGGGVGSALGLGAAYVGKQITLASSRALVAGESVQLAIDGETVPQSWQIKDLDTNAGKMTLVKDGVELVVGIHEVQVLVAPPDSPATIALQSGAPELPATVKLKGTSGFRINTVEGERVVLTKVENGKITTRTTDLVALVKANPERLSGLEVTINGDKFRVGGMDGDALRVGPHRMTPRMLLDAAPADVAKRFSPPPRAATPFGARPMVAPPLEINLGQVTRTLAPAIEGVKLFDAHVDGKPVTVKVFETAAAAEKDAAIGKQLHASGIGKEVKGVVEHKGGFAVVYDRIASVQNPKAYEHIGPYINDTTVKNLAAAIDKLKAAGLDTADLRFVVGKDNEIIIFDTTGIEPTSATPALNAGREIAAFRRLGHGRPIADDVKVADARAALDAGTGWAKELTASQRRKASELLASTPADRQLFFSRDPKTDTLWIFEQQLLPDGGFQWVERAINRPGGEKAALTERFNALGERVAAQPAVERAVIEPVALPPAWTEPIPALPQVGANKRNAQIFVDGLEYQIATHATPGDFAAVRVEQGERVILKNAEIPYKHDVEMWNAMNGVMNAIEGLDEARLNLIKGGASPNDASMRYVDAELARGYAILEAFDRAMSAP